MAGDMMPGQINLEFSEINLDISFKVSLSHSFTRLANRSLVNLL